MLNKATVIRESELLTVYMYVSLVLGSKYVQFQIIQPLSCSMIVDTCWGWPSLNLTWQMLSETHQLAMYMQL